jgi:hypothetical protein
VSGFEQGGDAQAISRIAKSHYGGFKQMFDAYGWDVPGNKLMTSAPRLIVEQYGSIEKFVAAHTVPRFVSAEDIWDQGYSVFWKSFWGWSPETWGCVGFTQAGRRDTILRKSTNPFICAIYVTKTADVDDVSLQGKVAGFYLVTHKRGHRNEFTDQGHYDLEPEKWQQSLRAIRAFTYLPEYRPDPYELDPILITRVRSVGSSGQFPSESVVDGLSNAPYREVPVYGGRPVARPDFIVPDAGRESQKTGVRGGTVNRSGYTVPGEPADTPKELYVLRLEGDVSAFLPDNAPADTQIFKIGLSMSPSSRMATFNAALPGDRFQWVIHRTTREDGHDPYPSFEAALAGEDEMKRVLGAPGGWMGGEFYAATPDLLERAWERGIYAADKFVSRIERRLGG